ncbi:ASKHA domain-containing protein, partial [Desulfosporosinus sp. BG]|uniref:ASKHA domain-containing protein n=1 Tax=Desulfosporosinus sp. BG TaxID=1633135 RepID=UPI00083B4497
MPYKVIFQPSGRRGMATKDKTLLQVSRELGVDIESPCGGAGKCGKCKVKIEAGGFNLSSLTEQEKALLTAEEQADNIRLACCAKIQGDVMAFVPEQSSGGKQVILETAQERDFNLNPALRKYYIEMEKPSLEDSRDDFRRLTDALTGRFSQLKDLQIDYSVILTLPDSLRQSGWRVTATLWQDKEIVAVEPGRVETSYGMAVDIGTTTIAAYLCDLATGNVVQRDSLLNSQVRFGDDVISRISYCMMNEDGLAYLHNLIINDLNTLVARMTQAAGLNYETIYEMVLVFNTAMHHITLNIDPQYMGRVPFASAIRSPLNIKARDLGIKIARSGNVHCLPVEAGFVGADNVSVLIAEEPYKQNSMMLVIDIGTNGEIDLGNAEGMMSTSCATGPALEGAQIKYGMRAAPGAIERVKINRYTYEPACQVIGGADCLGAQPQALVKGICGSGIIDAAAELFKAGIIHSDGRFNKELNSPRIRRGADGKMEYVLAWSAETAIGQDVTITQKDIRAVQLAKAALYAGAKILMQKRGVAKIDRVVLAGAFGSYINKESALVIGMFPDCALENVTAVGNAAGEGAKLALLDLGKRAAAREIAASIQFVETAAEEDFQKHFFEALDFPHAKDPFPHIKHDRP